MLKLRKELNLWAFSDSHQGQQNFYGQSLSGVPSRVIKEIFMEKNMYEKLPTLRQYLDFVPFYSGIRLSITLKKLFDGVFLVLPLLSCRDVVKFNFTIFLIA